MGAARSTRRPGRFTARNLEAAVKMEASLDAAVKVESDTCYGVFGYEFFKKLRDARERVRAEIKYIQEVRHQIKWDLAREGSRE